MVTVVAPVALTLEEVAALLFDWVYTEGHSVTWTTRKRPYFVAESVLNAGCLRLDEATAATAAARNGDILEFCRQRVTAVFAPCTTARQSRRPPGRPGSPSAPSTAPACHSK